MRREVLVVGLLLVAACASAPPAREGVAGAAGASPSSTSGAAPAGAVEPGLVDGATGHRLAEQGVRVIDVRTPEEFKAGHVPGALNIPHDQVTARAGEIGDPSTPVLLYCKTGRRSALAAEALRQQGFTHIYDMKSFDAWVAAEGDGGR